MIESSDFCTFGYSYPSEWVFETTWFTFSRHTKEGRLLFHKSLKAQYLEDEQLRNLLRKEYETGRMVGEQTDYIVNYYQLVDTKEACYVTMDYVEGCTLDELIRSEPQYCTNLSNAKKVFLQLLEGMSVLHHNQVVHLDLKPSNIMLTRVSHDIRIIDLGFCYSDVCQDTMGMTDYFAAPEQIDGSCKVDARTDIYSLGKLLEWFSTQLGDQCSWLKKNTFQKIKNKCLCTQKEERWQSVEEILAYLHKKDQQVYKQVWGGALGIGALIVALYLLFQQPIVGTDKHVMYGNFSLLHATCNAVGKTSNDQEDPYWQGNLYVNETIKHWGIQFTVIGIADNAFYKDSSFHTIHLPNTLQYIGENALRECHGLQSVYIPERVTTIGEYNQEIKGETNVEIIPVIA